ncbi:DUF2442 domain-containing protein [Algimonas porphyrae]|uniref:Uncharacterized protein n=1 Tax=Algimonas porphyrae TaxID=1128113 RepID=A0ABQ5V0B7_9PROT|nr:DUF2442 domain-containing protein [Algimonas porphyrae]GLQ21000.1 hypothetical protein GCM10007854_19550 [Algimonas porphyrae]
MEEAWELAVVSGEEVSTGVPLIVGCNRSPDFIELAVNDGRVLGLPIVNFPRLKEISDEEFTKGLVLPLGEGVYWSELDVLIKAEAAFSFEQDIEKLKPHALSHREVLDFEISQPNNHRLSDTELQYSDAAIGAFSRGEASTGHYVAASFAPVVLVFGLLQSFSDDGVQLHDLVGLAAIVLLSMTGIFFGICRAMLTAKRNYIEGYKLGLLSSYRFRIFPTKIWRWVSNTFLLAIMPFGYVLVMITIILILL